MKTANIEPIALTNSVANLLNINLSSLSGPVGITIPGLYLVITHIRITNKTALSVNASMWKGGSGASVAGTEFGFANTPVPAYDSLDFDCNARFDAADFLTGLAGSSSALTVTIDADIGIAG